MDDFQLQQRIVPDTTRFEWIGGDPGGTTDYSDKKNWQDLDFVLRTYPANLPTTSSYLQFDASATTNCLISGSNNSVGEISILKATDAAGAFKFKIEIPHGIGLYINNNATTELDYYRNANTSDFRSGVIQIDGWTSAGTGGTLAVGGGTLNWDGPLSITVDPTGQYKGQFVLWNSVTANIKGPDGGSRQCSAHIYDGYLPALNGASAATVHENSFSALQGLNLNNSADVDVSAAGLWHFDQTGANDTTTGGITGDGQTPQTFTNQGSVFRDGSGETGMRVDFLTSGHVTVNTSNTLDFLGTPAVVTNSYVQTAGTTDLQNGAKINALQADYQGFSMTGGSLQTDAAIGNYGTSFLYGKVTITGGVVRIGVGAAGTLKGDDGTWSITGATTIYFALDPNDVLHSDQIVTSGTITLGSPNGTQPTIDVTISSAPQPPGSHPFYALFTGSSVPTATTGVHVVYHGPFPNPLFEANPDPMGALALGMKF